MATSTSNFPDRLKIVDDKGDMTPEFRRYLDDALTRRNPMVLQPLKNTGADFIGDLAGKTTTVADGVIITVV